MEGLKLLTILTTLFTYAMAQLDPEIPNHCPKDNSVNPCTCKPDYDGSCFITCYAVNIHALYKLAKQPNLCNGKINFRLVHSKVSGIPRDLWKILLTSETVDVTIMYSKVDGIIPPGELSLPALSTPGSATIKIVHSKSISDWDWSHLSQFRSGYDLTLIISDTPMSGITESFSKIANRKVKKIAIDQTSIETLPDRAFAEFENLTSLSFQDNRLTEVKRSMFPNPAPKLHYLHLNGNDLTELPDDLFTNMPNLEIVYLRENELITLPENIFKSVNSKSMRLIDLVHNPWDCDCDLWKVTDEADGYLDMGYCATPGDMLGKKADHLLNALGCDVE